MAHKLTVERKGAYLHLSVTGDNTVQDVAGYMEEGIGKSIELQCPYVLVEENLSGPELGLEAIMSIIQAISGPAAGSLRAVAFVNTNEQHDPGLTRFGENLATMHDVNVRNFRTVAEAERWIQYQSTAGRGASGR